MADSNKISTDIEPGLPGIADGECERAPLPLGNSEVAKRSVGRPAGSVNKKSKTLQKWLLSLGYQHPAVILAEIAARPVGELAKELGCKKIEAFQEQRKAAAELLPYFEGKILPKTDDGEQPLPVLNINVATDSLAQRGLVGDGSGAISVFANIQQNQDVIDVTPDASNDKPSNERAETQSNQELNDAEPTD